MRGARTRRRRNPRFAALCLLLIFAAVGAAVWLWAGRGLPGEGVEVPDYVQADLLTVNPWSRPGTPLEKIDGIVIHYVGNPGTTAKANRNYFESLSSGETETYSRDGAPDRSLLTRSFKNFLVLRETKRHS